LLPGTGEKTACRKTAITAILFLHAKYALFSFVMASELQIVLAFMNDMLGW